MMNVSGCHRPLDVPYIFHYGYRAFSARLYAPVAQLDRALACGARGRKFESCRVYHCFMEGCRSG